MSLELRLRSSGRQDAWFRVDAPDHVFALAPTLKHARVIVALPDLVSGATRLLEEAAQLGLDHSPGVLETRAALERMK